MKCFFRCLLIFTAAQLITFSNAVFAQQSVNAVIAGDFADPSIIRKGNQYYAVGTSSEWAPHFPIYTSTNLQDWKLTGYVFDKAPEWTTSSFWAPEYYFHNGTYFIYYTARRKKDNTSFIGVATSKFPDKGFTDHGVIIEHGKEAIDAFVFNDNGQLYIAFKAYGLDKRPIEILGSKLSADGLQLEGQLFSMLKDDKGIGLEGQSFLKKDDYYYMFYSAGNCCGVNCSYNVSVARSKSFEGPYENYNANPILQEYGDWKCSGHGTFVNSPDGKYHYLYHAYNKQATVYAGRQGMMAELTWPEKNGWPVFNVPTNAKVNHDIKDLFDGKTVRKQWQWDFRNATPAVKQAKGNLHLSGTAKPENEAGIVLTVRPVATNFEATTTVVNNNSALKGLAYYGDANAALGVGVVNDTVEFWIVKDKQYKVLANAAINGKLPVDVKIELLPDLSCKVFYKQGQNAWNELRSGQRVSAEFLPQWDRSPRIGPHFKGGASQDAEFSSFILKYN